MGIFRHKKHILNYIAKSPLCPQFKHTLFTWVLTILLYSQFPSACFTLKAYRTLLFGDITLKWKRKFLSIKWHLFSGPRYKKNKLSQRPMSILGRSWTYQVPCNLKSLANTEQTLISSLHHLWRIVEIKTNDVQVLFSFSLMRWPDLDFYQYLEKRYCKEACYLYL